MLVKLVKSIIPRPWRLFLKQKLYKIIYFGLKFKCPFCRGHFTKFLPYYAEEGGLQVVKEKHIIDAGNILDFYCPSCRSNSRERLIYLYLFNKTMIIDEKVNLLHIAPEINLQKVLKQYRNIEYLSGDIEPDKLSAMVKIDITNIQYPDNSFDIIICSHVLEHVTNDCQAIAEFYRILKPQGWAMLLVPIALLLENTFEDPTITDEKDRIRAFGQSDHVRIYGNDFQERLEQAGFQVSKFKWSESYEGFGNPGNKFGLIEDEVIYLAHKEKSEISKTVV